MTIDYYRLRTDGLPDFGVPLNINAKVPWPETGLPRDLWYGNAMRDFIKNESDILTTTVELKLSDAAKVTSRTRVGTNSSDYIASGPTGTNGPNVTMNNPQNRPVAPHDHQHERIALSQPGFDLTRDSGNRSADLVRARHRI